MQWHQTVTLKSVQCHPGLTCIFNFWHSCALALRAERQSARMSEIKTSMAVNPLNSSNLEQLASNGLRCILMPTFQKAFIDIRLCPGRSRNSRRSEADQAGHATPYGPLRPNVTSSIKPEVHNVAQRRRRRSEPRPQGICAQNFVKSGSAVPEICSQTDRQTGWSQYSAPLPGRSSKVWTLPVDLVLVRLEPCN